MKKKVVKQVIPEHTIEKEVYVCETCGSEYDSPIHFQECSFCGKDTCSNCRKYQVDYLEELGVREKEYTLTFTSKERYLVCACNDCKPRLNQLIQQKRLKMQELVNTINEQLANLTLEKLDDILE